MLGMWKTYRSIILKYSKIPLREERRLIRRAKKGQDEAVQEIVLRHIGFIIFRIHKRAFPTYAHRYGEDILSQAIVILYQKINFYNLRYYDKEGNFKPVRFATYIWKCIDGLILASLKKEIHHEKRNLTQSRGIGMTYSKEFLEKTIKVWQPYSKEPLTLEDARVITENMVDLAKLLAELDRNEKPGSTGNRDQHDTAS